MPTRVAVMLNGKVCAEQAAPERVEPRGAVNGSARSESSDGFDTAIDTEAVAPARVPGRPADVAIGDWDVLFRAVEDRLRANAVGPLEQPLRTVADDTAARVRVAVLECVDALEQLRASVEPELRRCQALETQASSVHAELAELRVELSRRKTGEKQLRHLSRHDSLTTLPNRYHFRERLALVLTTAEPTPRGLALLYIDLDDFKAVNDAHGHRTGDQLLRIVAARLTRALRAQDLVGRLGGDEFACLLARIPNREQLLQVVRKLSDAVGAPVQIGSLQLQVRLSIGIAVHDGLRVSAEVLLDRADMAMYHAKRNGTGHAFFEQVPGRPAKQGPQP